MPGSAAVDGVSEPKAGFRLSGLLQKPVLRILRTSYARLKGRLPDARGTCGGQTQSIGIRWKPWRSHALFVLTTDTAPRNLAAIPQSTSTGMAAASQRMRQTSAASLSGVGQETMRGV